MINTILGKKMSMSQAFVGETRVPVTRVLAGPCEVVHIKKSNKEGFWKVQIGFGERKLKNTPKSLQGHLKGAIKENKAPFFLREVSVEGEPKVKVGDTVTFSEVLKKGDLVSVTGKSKGKGFTGVVKRWGFAGGPKTHGQSDRQRAPGSIGQGTTPGRVWKGKKMAGRSGFDTVTVKNLRVVNLDPESNEIALSGSIPGPTGGLLVIKKISSGSVEDLEEKVQEVQIKEAEEEPEEEKEKKSE